MGLWMNARVRTDIDWVDYSDMSLTAKSIKEKWKESQTNIDTDKQKVNFDNQEHALLHKVFSWDAFKKITEAEEWEDKTQALLDVKSEIDDFKSEFDIIESGSATEWRQTSAYTNIEHNYEFNNNKHLNNFYSLLENKNNKTKIASQLNIDESILPDVYDSHEKMHGTILALMLKKWDFSLPLFSGKALNNKIYTDLVSWNPVTMEWVTIDYVDFVHLIWWCYQENNDVYKTVSEETWWYKTDYVMWDIFITSEKIVFDDIADDLSLAKPQWWLSGKSWSIDDSWNNEEEDPTNNWTWKWELNESTEAVSINITADIQKVFGDNFAADKLKIEESDNGKTQKLLVKNINGNDYIELGTLDFTLWSDTYQIKLDWNSEELKELMPKVGDETDPVATMQVDIKKNKSSYDISYVNENIIPYFKNWNWEWKSQRTFIIKEHWVDYKKTKSDSFTVPTDYDNMLVWYNTEQLQKLNTVRAMINQFNTDNTELSISQLYVNKWWEPLGVFLTQWNPTKQENFTLDLSAFDDNILPLFIKWNDSTISTTENQPDTILNDLKKYNLTLVVD